MAAEALEMQQNNSEASLHSSEVDFTLREDDANGSQRNANSLWQFVKESKWNVLDGDAGDVTTNRLCEVFLGFAADDNDEFQSEVARKTGRAMLDRWDAEKEVIVDRLVAKHGNSREKALLHIVKAEKAREPQVLIVLKTLTAHKLRISEEDDNGMTALHHATRLGFEDVVRELLAKGAQTEIRDCQRKMPLHIALEDLVSADNIAVLLLNRMRNRTVRSLFTVPDNSKPDDTAEISMQSLILKEKMHKTVLAVLDCMIDHLGPSSSVRVHYSVLEADERGRSPRNPNFDVNSMSCIHLMSRQGYKNLVYHDVVRLLLKRKWTGFAKRSFLVNAALFVFFQVTLCISVVLASMAPDPANYSGPQNIARAVFEILTLIAAAYSFVLELTKIRKHGKDFFTDKFHIGSLLSSLCIIIVVPLRFTHQEAQWYIYSIGFLLWTLRIFKFSAVFRTMGAYSQSLGRIVRHDFPQFLWVFGIILVTFSGSFLLALKGEDSLGVHEETSTFWHILLTGVRILVEGQPISEYYGSEGYRWFACTQMVIFLGTCCVVLLSILIAQLSDTYQNVQSDAHRGLELNRAWIITRVELNSIYLKNWREPFRIIKYVTHEEITNPKEVLNKWDNPPLSDINREVKDIKDQSESQFRKMRHDIYKRIEQQEKLMKQVLHNVEEVRNLLLAKQDTKSALDPPAETS